jgi:hypothetical protein
MPTEKGYYIRKSDKEEYALTIKPDAPLGRTHQCKNKEHYWEGTQAQFIEAFEIEAIIASIKETPQKAAAALIGSPPKPKGRSKDKPDAGDADDGSKGGDGDEPPPR